MDTIQKQIQQNELTFWLYKVLLKDRGRKWDDGIFWYIFPWAPVPGCEPPWQCDCTQGAAGAVPGDQSRAGHCKVRSVICHVSCVMCHVSCVISCICRAVLNQDIRVKGVSLDIDGGKCLPARIKCPHNQKYFNSKLWKEFILFS